MFCPTCGRDNAKGLKFCAACGTNLEAVSQALSDNGADFFTKTDSALDQFIARYAEHVFRSAPAHASDRKRIGNSWKVLGQGIATSFLDLVLFILMWNVFPIKFLILLVTTPIRVLSERSSYRRGDTAELESGRALDLTEPAPQKWLPGAFVSVTEQTTVKLEERASQKPGLD